jgi:DHA2 family multidrug resistance protein
LRDRWSQVGAFAAAQQALGMIYGSLVRQAMLLSYVQTFRMLAVLCVACVPLVLLLRRARTQGPVSMH